MSIFSRIRSSVALRRKIDERIYQIVAEELAKGDIKEGLMAKDFAQSEGDENKAKAKYIQLRARSIQDEQALSRQSRRLVDSSEVLREKAIQDAFKKSEEWQRHVGMFERPKPYK